MHDAYRKAFLTATIVTQVLFYVASRTLAASVSLFTTQEDFTNWSVDNSTVPFTLTPGTAGDSDGSSINGLGNPTNPGGTGTPGALTVSPPPNTFFGYYFSPFEQSNPVFISALEYGNAITLDYTNTGASGNFFNIGIVLFFVDSNSNGHFDQFYDAGELTSVGTHSDTIDYNDPNLTALIGQPQPILFQLGLIYNDGAEAPLEIDNIAVNFVPEPTSLSALMLCGLLTLRRFR